MPTTYENRIITTTAPSAANTHRPTSDARVAAVVQAAYILEARSR